MHIRPVTDADEKSFQEIMKSSIAEICAEEYGEEIIKAQVSDDNPAFHFTIPQLTFVGEDRGMIG